MNEIKTPRIRFKGFTDDWEQRKLGDIATYKNGNGHEDSQADEGTYELINLNSISIDGGLKPSGKFIEDGSDTLRKNDLVMVLSDVGHGDLLGRVAIIPENNKFVLNQRVALLRINDDTNPYFLFSIINRHQDYFKKLGAGSSQLNISRGTVEDFVVDYPCYDEQKKIANYFRNLDNLITLHQREYEKLQIIKKSMLENCFPKNGEKVPRIRFAGFTGDWEQRKLSDIANVYDGVHQTPDYQKSGVMFLSVEDIATLTSDKYITQEAFERDYKSYPEKGDILMTRIGDVGTPNVVETVEKVAFYVSLALLKPKNVDSYFLCNVIRSPEFQRGLKSRTLVTAIPQKINKDEIGKVEFLMPQNAAEQKAIGAYFKNLDHLITLHQSKLEKLQKIKKSLLERMFA